MKGLFATCQAFSHKIPPNLTTSLRISNWKVVHVAIAFLLIMLQVMIKTWTFCLGMTPDATRVVLNLENDDSELVEDKLGQNAYTSKDMAILQQLLLDVRSKEAPLRVQISVRHVISYRVGLLLYCLGLQVLVLGCFWWGIFEAEFWGCFFQNFSQLARERNEDHLFG